MATTTNYSWTTPDDTALVKDGAAAIRSLGSSIDTTTKNLNPSTTLGDIEYRSSTANTNTRLGIGTTGQILTVSGGVPSWATPAAAGGMTLLETLTLTGASVTSSTIAGTYKNLQVIVRNFKPATDNTDMVMRFNSDSNTRYKELFTGASMQTFSGTGIGLNNNADNSVSSSLCIVNIYDYANTVTWKFAATHRITQDGEADTSKVNLYNFFAAYNQTSAITTLQFLPSTGNFTSGSVLIYGVS